MTRSERRREERRIKKLQTLPQYALATAIEPTVQSMVADGLIFEEEIVAADDIGGMAAYYERLQKRGFWRSPQLDATCAQCHKDFVLRFWLEHKPSPHTPESLNVRDSEGGLIMHDPLVHVTADGLRWNWIALCDGCAPV